MHTLTFVLLRPPFGDLSAAIDSLLAPHRMKDDEYDPARRWDYWTMGDNNIADAETETAIGLAEDDEYHGNVCFVSRLEGRRTPAAIVTPDGAWHDLFDFGWKFMERDTTQGQQAYDRWCAHAAALLAAHRDCLAVEIDTHS